MSAALVVEDLIVEVGAKWRAVDRVSFAIERGGSVGLVGESGCGKTLTAKAIMGLLSRPIRVAGGSVHLDGEELTRAPERRLRELRGAKIGMIFQEPMTALNPVLSAGTQVAEVFQLHRGLSRRAARTAAGDMFTRVKLPDPGRVLDSYPHQLSGGMRQRVMIAMALALDPLVLIADEPTTALDVTVQAEILELIAELRRERGTAVLMITHDLAVVSKICERALVMYAGQIVESARIADIFAKPLHPYTAGLLSSLPESGVRGQKLRAIPGSVPEPGEISVTACRFATRCSRREDRCGAEAPILFESPGVSRRTRCFFPGEVSR